MVVNVQVISFITEGINEISKVIDKLVSLCKHGKATIKTEMEFSD